MVPGLAIQYLLHETLALEKAEGHQYTGYSTFEINSTRMGHGMEDFIRRHQDVWGDNPSVLMDRYDYQSELTKKLDGLDATQLTEQTLLEIVLWKLDRYPQLDTSLLEEIKAVGHLKAKQHREAKDVLGKLLLSSGIRLPMASTILRFVNPDVFQIIDERAFRMLRPNLKNYPDKPVVKTRLSAYVEKSSEIYFDYLDAIHEVVSEKLPFRLADRILYQLDIERDNKIRQKRSATK
ncbi:hypothetical protein NLK61_27425 [Pseudomonas fuscovaginae UPB0736]|uniref:hypothetical protein n=1 Tax=Pseudomonas asplenii TaxID=53407 RepID=UPI000287E439|nr:MULTISPECIES: hypothetical protein [Pseudomonas]UUQ64881.1 hypothetical protein NLK61_27425 [Pseudomonas fuscovaginae UPB0736]UZE26640.1 hypothetical protein LOY63_14615 [Pseudomonas asplenii]